MNKLIDQVKLQFTRRMAPYPNSITLIDQNFKLIINNLLFIEYIYTNILSKDTLYLFK